MRVGSKEEVLTEKAELFMAIRDYESEEKKRWDKGIDFIATQAKSNDKVLLRVITEPKSSSGTVGVDGVKEIVETVKREEYDKAILFSKRFSKAAREELRREGIQIVSEKVSPSFKPQRLYLRMQDYIDDLCQTKCGYIPEKESDCKGKNSQGQYSCKIRLISDNASFHFEHGWAKLLQRDFERLISLHH